VSLFSQYPQIGLQRQVQAKFSSSERTIREPGSRVKNWEDDVDVVHAAWMRKGPADREEELSKDE